MLTANCKTKTKSVKRFEKSGNIENLILELRDDRVLLGKSNIGGGGGNRTRIQRLRPVKSTRLARLLGSRLRQVSKQANLAENQPD